MVNRIEDEQSEMMTNVKAAHALCELVVSVAVAVAETSVGSDADTPAVPVAVAVAFPSTVTTVTYGTTGVYVVVYVTGSAVTAEPLTEIVVESGISVDTSTTFVTGICVRNVITFGFSGSVKFTSPVGSAKGFVPLYGSGLSQGLVELEEEVVG